MHAQDPVAFHARMGVHMRYLFAFISVLALGVLGCGETAGTGGSGGTAGTGGSGGMGGGGAIAGTGGDGGTDVMREWGTPELIETDAEDARFARVAMDPSGNAIAVWQQSDGTRTNIWSNRYTPTSGWGTAELIENDNAGIAWGPGVAMDPSGNAIAVWQQSDGTRENIWSNRYTATSGWSSAELIENDDTGSATRPQVAINPSGNAVAVWQQSDGTRENIWSNRYTATSGWSSAELVETDTGDALFPQVAIDPSGYALAVWQHWGGQSFYIVAELYRPHVGWGSGALVENAGGSAFPEVAMDENGNAVAVWQQSDGTRTSIWSSRSRYKPSNVWDWDWVEIIENDNAGNAFTSSLAMDPSGRAVAVWEQYDGLRFNIWSNRYTPSDGWGTAELLENDNAGDAATPRVAVDPHGKAVAVWQQSDGTRTNIWSNRYTPSDGWGTAELLENDNAGDALEPDVAMDAGGNAIAVWYQWDDMRRNIWSSRLQ